jgi:hypothetical protein
LAPGYFLCYRLRRPTVSKIPTNVNVHATINNTTAAPN